MYKIVDYGSYCAISTWTKIRNGEVVAKASTYEEAQIKLKIYEQEKQVASVCN
jgi:hypothetical protein